MCTLVILRRPGQRWPLLLAANRDEMQDRPWRAPGRHWPDRPHVVAGMDELAGGSWLGLNDDGVVAGVLNRPGSLGPAPGMRSRGELVLEALDHADAASAVAALSNLSPEAYRPFNLMVADDRDAFWLRLAEDGPGRVESDKIAPGLSMITAHDLNDPASARVRTFLPRLRAAPEPDPDDPKAGWSSWEKILASRDDGGSGDPSDALAIVTDFGFATVSGSLIALPPLGCADRKPIWRFAAGRPGTTAYEKLPI